MVQKPRRRSFSGFFGRPGSRQVQFHFQPGGLHRAADHAAAMGPCDARLYEDTLEDYFIRVTGGEGIG